MFYNIASIFNTNNSIINTIIMNEIQNQLMFREMEDEDEENTTVLFAPIQIIYQGESDDE